MTKERYEAILWAHRLCCPYHHNYIGDKVQGIPKPLPCGLGHEKCDGDCWYMETFKKVLDGAIAVNP